MNCVRGLIDDSDDNDGDEDDDNDEVSECVDLDDINDVHEDGEEEDEHDNLVFISIQLLVCRCAYELELAVDAVLHVVVVGAAGVVGGTNVSGMRCGVRLDIGGSIGLVGH